MSNLPGAGRILGNLLSKAGSTLEKCIEKLGNRSRLKEYANAEQSMLSANTMYSMMTSGDTAQQESAYESLLSFARYECPFYLSHGPDEDESKGQKIISFR